ncbi:Retrovirus-related Pol polyprotein from transposon TNT 1-94-like protein [Drosera capensis]
MIRVLSFNRSLANAIFASTSLEVATNGRYKEILDICVVVYLFVIVSRSTIRDCFILHWAQFSLCKMLFIDISYKPYGVCHISPFPTNMLSKAVEMLKIHEDTVCAGYQYDKVYQFPFKESQFKAKVSLEFVYSDVFGPVKQPSIIGLRYMITFIDDYLRYVWVYFMKEKFETLSMYKIFKEYIEKELGTMMQCLRSDNGDEYTPNEFKTFLCKNKIRRLLTCPDTPQQNIVAERKTVRCIFVGYYDQRKG